MIIYKRFQLNSNKNDFLKELRKNTREPFYDNKNKRRSDSDDKIMILSEYDNLLYLKKELIGHKWITYKTLIIPIQKNNKLVIHSLFYPGGLGGIFYCWFGLFAILFFGINQLYVKGDFTYIIGSVLLFILFTFSGKEEFKTQRQILINCVNNIKQ